MAANTKVVLENLVDGYLADAGQIRGTYVVVKDDAAKAALSTTAIIVGSRCYVSDSQTTYQWDGASWKDVTEEWEFTLLDGSVVKKRVALLDSTS